MIKKATQSAKYKQLYKDIQYIKSAYGDIYDFCGGWCNCDILNQLLERPNKYTAFRILMSKLETYFEDGYDYMSYKKNLPIETDKRLQRIKKRWIEGE